MLVNTYNQNGEKVGQARLPSEIFDVKTNPDLLHQVVVAQMANRRQIVAHTKTRGEVRGGGRKPWRQKGTGRARHGSIRSPLWKGGGVTFGPRKEKIYKQKINKKMARLALFMALSSKAKDNELLILEDLKIEKPKTKLMAEILNKLPSKSKSVLIALPKKEETIIRATSNIPAIQTIEARNLNALDLLSYKYLLMPKEAIKAIKETFVK
jgi:large subunit ribosomal protein L4